MDDIPYKMKGIKLLRFQALEIRSILRSFKRPVQVRRTNQTSVESTIVESWSSGLVDVEQIALSDVDDGNLRKFRRVERTKLDLFAITRKCGLGGAKMEWKLEMEERLS